MPGVRDRAEVAGADDLIVVHVPGDDLAIGVAPGNVALAVAVEVADAGDVPGARDRAESAGTNDLTVVQVPGGDLSVDVAPEDVALAVAIEVACSYDLPGVRHRAEIVRGKLVAVGVPGQHLS